MRSLIIILALLPLLVQGQQNLVLNGGFEEFEFCPENTSQWSVYNWATPTFTPDYFNICAPVNVNYSASVPTNISGYQMPHGGDAYAGIASFGLQYSNVREYIQTVLLDTLTAGIRYYVGFHVSPADRFQYAISTLGASLTLETPPVVSFGHPDGMLGADPQVLQHGRLPLTDTIRWVLISDTVLAQGGERYLSIGNFHLDGESDTLRFNPNQPPINGSATTSAYYYIDDVFVYAIDSVPSGIAEQEALGFELWPNPAKEFVQFRISDSSASRKNGTGSSSVGMTVQVLDALGRSVAAFPLQKGVSAGRGISGELDVSTLPIGIYFLELTDQEGNHALRKFVKE